MPKKTPPSGKPTPATSRANPARRPGKPAPTARNGAPATRNSRSSSNQTAGISSEAVERATGKSWDAWFGILDKAGARKLEHKAIAELLHGDHGLSGQWSQMVTVGYEQARLGRKKHEKPGGFEVSVSRTIQTPVGAMRSTVATVAVAP